MRRVVKGREQKIDWDEEKGRGRKMIDGRRTERERRIGR